MFIIEDELKKLPDKPGVYLMYNDEDTVIYVGKAISLKKRVRQYFNRDKNKHPKVVAMVSNIVRFEYIIVSNEVEALILESNLIKHHKPRYNVLLRDDKQYPYIRITDETFPRVQKVRSVKKDSAKYFGPFPNAYAVNDIISLLTEIYSIRTCNLDFDKGQQLKRPCLNYFIDRCPAPCVGIANEDVYMQNINDIIYFLQGKQTDILAKLTRQMQAASASLNYELAATYRNHIHSIELIMEKQKISQPNQVDIDIIAMARGTRHVCLQVFFYRNGKLVDREHFIMDDKYKDTKEEILSSFMTQFYLDNSYIPQTILIEDTIDEKDSLEKYLGEKKGTKVHILIPQKGNKFKMLEMAKKNAQDMLLKYEAHFNKREGIYNAGLSELESILNLSNLERLEAYDISNTSGALSVGSMVVFKNGKKAPKEYRKFKIKTVEGTDDYASHEEMLRRRLNRALLEIKNNRVDSGFGELPDLILIDGGKGHVHRFEAVLQDFKLDIPVCGMVKNAKHKTDSIYYKDTQTTLDKNSPIFKFLYKVQEEVHRFTFNYHKTLRSKTLSKSELDEISGIGPKKKQLLLSTFKSIENIKNLTIDELKGAKGISKTDALNIFNYFKNKEQ